MIHATMWMNFENVMLRKINRDKGSFIVLLLLYGSIYMTCPKCAIHRDRKWINDCQELGMREGKMNADCVHFLFVVMEISGISVHSSITL
jgi:hypothetical protein